ncbi:hypothetical protein SS1_28 [Cronobacter phage vB_CsaP_Ss1]|nr:hypothetical protein SS1_28 [Cronobacter phage vB_CsaP_Ss1]
MELNMYAVKAQQTAVFTRNDYPLVALGEEVGEVMGKIAKFGRKNDMSVEEVINAIANPETQAVAELRAAIKKEMGDVLWQWAVLCNALCMSPNHIAEENLFKLQDRKERNVLNGEGDER